MIHTLRSTASHWLRARAGVFLAAVLGLATGSTALRAGTQSLTIYGTNVAPGTIDPNTDCSKDGDVTWLPAYALIPDHPWQAQYPIAGTTKWISRSTDGQSASTTSGSNPEVLDFRIRFYAPADLTAPSITFILDPDNYGDIYLNGAKMNSSQIVGPSTVQYTVSNANIVPGLNTILVRLTDTGGWLGINYSITVSGNSASNTPFQRLVAPSAVTNVTSSTTSGDFKAGTVIPIQLTFTNAVTVTGTPTLTLATGTNDTATYVSGSGTSTLTFNYTVKAGDAASHLDFASTSALALNGGTIISAAADAQAANLTLPSPGASGSLGANTSIIIDTTAPILNVPSNKTTYATSAAGGTTVFAATAADAVTPSPTIAYSAASGSTFPLGTTTVNVTATDGAGNVTAGSFTVTVNPYPAGITLTTPTNYAYDGTGKPATAVTTIGGLTVNFVYDGTSTSAPVTGGTHSVTASLAPGQAWATATPVSGSVVIAPATATVTATPYSGTYDGAAHAGTVSATGVGGANLSALVSVTGSFTNVPGGSASWSFVDPAGNYRSSSGSVPVTITRAAATVTVTGYQVTYDGNSHQATGTATGVKGEALAGLALGQTARTNAGGGSDAWTFTDVTGNYTNQSGHVIDSINPAPVTFSATPLSLAYNGSAQGPTITTSPANATYLVQGTASATNSGFYQMVLTGTGNYTGTSPALIWQIAAASAQLSWPAPAGITYGTPLGAAQLDATANVPGTFSYSPDAGAIVSAGSGRTLTATFTPADQGNYRTQTITTTIDVAANSSTPVVTVPAALTLTATGPAGAVGTYAASATDALGLPIFADDFESPTINTGTYSAVTTVGSSPVTFGAWNFSSTAGVINGANSAWGGTAPYAGNQYIWLQDENFNGTGQGSIESAQAMQLVAGQTYTVWWAQASRTNNGGALTYAVSINTAAGSAQIFSRSTKQGEAWQYYAASFTATASGPATLQFSTISAPNVDNSIFLDDIAVTTTAAVPVALNPASGSTFAPNTTTTVTGTATNIAGTQGSNGFTVSVVPQQVSISFTTPAYTYDGTAKAASATTNPGGLPVTFLYSGSPNAPVNAGSYPVSASVDAGWAVGTTAGSLTINQAQANLLVTPYAVTYDGNAHTAAATATGAQGESLLSDLNLTATTRTNAGSTNDSWSFTDPNGNYASVSGAVLDVIAPATPKFVVTGYAVTYDGNPHTAAGAAIGVNGDSFPVNVAATVHSDAGSYTDAWSFGGTLNYSAGNGTVSDSIAKANAAITVTPYSVTYDGAAHTATSSITGVKGESLSGLTVTGTTHTHAGTYNGDGWTFTDATGNYNSTSGAVNDAISVATATVTVTGYSLTFDGSAHTATATVVGVSGALAATDVDLSKTTRTAAGTTTDAWSFADASGNYATASGTVTDVISKATPVIAATPYSVTFDGAAHTATATVTGVANAPIGTVNVSGTTHTNAGSYTDTVSYTDTTGNYGNASQNITDIISKAKATVTVNPYSVMYDGAAHTATGSVTGVGGVVLSGLDLSGTTHTLPGGYSDTWTFTDSTGNYQSVAATTISDNIGITGLVRQSLTLNGMIDGSIQVLTGSADVLNGNSTISGDLIVPGTPTVIQNGHVTYAGTVDQTGSASPSNYQIILNGNVTLRHVIRRVNPIAMPTVPVPPAPTGTQSVTINKSGQAAPNWSTANNVTLNGNVGTVTMPAGTYGTVVVNGNSTLVLGVAGATTPAVYNLQGLTINGNGALEIVGPVVINALNTVTANGNVGLKAHPEWLAVNVASGGVTLNGNVVMYGNVVAPTLNKGQVVINGNSDLYGSVTADSLIVNGNGLLDQTQ